MMRPIISLIVPQFSLHPVLVSWYEHSTLSDAHVNATAMKNRVILFDNCVILYDNCVILCDNIWYCVILYDNVVILCDNTNAIVPLVLCLLWHERDCSCFCFWCIECVWPCITLKVYSVFLCKSYGIMCDIMWDIMWAWLLCNRLSNQCPAQMQCRRGVILRAHVIIWVHM